MTKRVSLTTDPEQSDGECPDTPDVPVNKSVSKESEAVAESRSPSSGQTGGKYQRAEEDMSPHESPSSATNEQHSRRKSSSEEHPDRHGRSNSPSPRTAQHGDSPEPESVAVSSSVHRVREPQYAPPSRHDMRQFESESEESGELSASDDDETRVKGLRSFVQVTNQTLLYIFSILYINTQLMFVYAGFSLPLRYRYLQFWHQIDECVKTKYSRT